MAPSTCPICESSAHTSWALRKNACDLHECVACDHLYVVSIESQEGPADYQGFDGDEGEAEFVDRVERLLRFRSSGRVLDVGCHSGAFLGLAKKRGFEVHGVELNPDAAAVALERGFPVSVGTLAEAAFPDESFHAVHLGDVIEHIDEVKPLVAEIRRVLKPGGLLLIATPNHAAFFPRATRRLYESFGVPWSHPTPPEHLHQFSTRSLEKLLTGGGYAIEDVVHGPALIAYELRATGAFAALRRPRPSPRWVAEFLRAVLTGTSYTAVWLVDRAMFLRKSDTVVHLIASRTPAGDDS